MTMDYDKLEQRIADEYNIVHAWIALHPYVSAFGFFMVGLGIGKLL
jgi:hypothetical protein